MKSGASYGSPFAAVPARLSSICQLPMMRLRYWEVSFEDPTIYNPEGPEGRGGSLRVRLKAVPRKILFICNLSFVIIIFPLYGENQYLTVDVPITIVSPETVMTGEIILPRETYLIPQTIFIGDKGRLVANLGPAFEGTEAFILQSPQSLSFINDRIIKDPAIKDPAIINPVLKDNTISRIELEKRNNNIRLIIDFVSYKPGSFTLPLLRFQSEGSKTLILGGLEICVASILTPDIMVLSDPAPPLAVPGMGFIVYGALGTLLVVSFLGIGGLFWVRRYLGPFQEKLRQRKLRISLEKKLKQLRIEENELQQKELFSLLAGEFREFLSLLTGVNCGVLTPLEFLRLPVEIPGSSEPDYLYRLFQRWDQLRFSGAPLAQAEVFVVLDDLGSFLTNLRNAEKES
jgi:hypothetical protein